MDWYNGFSPAQRNANGRALRLKLLAGEMPTPSGACSLCGDPEAKLEYHSEDYSKPYSWSAPAAYPLCRNCHRNWLHKRFADQHRWEAFKAHVRRGGYEGDLRDPSIRKELADYENSLKGGPKPSLRTLREYRSRARDEWWEDITMDPLSIRRPWTPVR